MNSGNNGNNAIVYTNNRNTWACRHVLNSDLHTNTYSYIHTHPSKRLSHTALDCEHNIRVRMREWNTERTVCKETREYCCCCLRKQQGKKRPIACDVVVYIYNKLSRHMLSRDISRTYSFSAQKFSITAATFDSFKIIFGKCFQPFAMDKMSWLAPFRNGRVRGNILAFKICPKTDVARKTG